VPQELDQSFSNFVVFWSLLFESVSCSPSYFSESEISDEFTPLHEVFYHSSEILMVAHMQLLSFPASPAESDALLICVDENSETPLHMALKVGRYNSRDGKHNPRKIDMTVIIKLLVDSEQNVLMHKNCAKVYNAKFPFVFSIESNTPVHLAVMRKMSWAVLVLLINQDQSVLRQRNLVDKHVNEEVDTSLQIVIRFARSPDLINRLINVHDRVLLVRNYFNNMPLHAAL